MEGVLVSASISKGCSHSFSVNLILRYSAKYLWCFLCALNFLLTKVSKLQVSKIKKGVRRTENVFGQALIKEEIRKIFHIYLFKT